MVTMTGGGDMVRGLVPETLREAPSCSLAHRLGLSHLQGAEKEAGGLGSQEPGNETNTLLGPCRLALQEQSSPRCR